VARLTWAPGSEEVHASCEVYHLLPPEQVGASVGLMRACSYMGAIITAALSGVFFSEQADRQELVPFALSLAIASGVVVGGDLVAQVVRRLRLDANVDRTVDVV
jgi:hypothetical protein